MDRREEIARILFNVYINSGEISKSDLKKIDEIVSLFPKLMSDIEIYKAIRNIKIWCEKGKTLHYLIGGKGIKQIVEALVGKIPKQETKRSSFAEIDLKETRELQKKIAGISGISRWRKRGSK